MAFLYYAGRIQLRDEHQMLGSKEVEIRIDDVEHATAAEQLSEAMAALSAYATAFDDVIDPIIVGVTLAVPVVVAGLKSSPGEQGVAQGASLKMTTTDQDAITHVRPYWLPGAKEGVFLSDFKTIDTGDADMIAFVGSFNVATGVEITVSDGEVVDGLNSGLYATRGRKSTA